MYRVMQAVRAQHPRLPISEFYLTGYSLGALDAAFVSHLDETRRSFNFKRVLLLNPPVNLYTSINNLDKLVQTQVKGIDHSTTFYELMLENSPATSRTRATSTSTMPCCTTSSSHANTCPTSRWPC